MMGKTKIKRYEEIDGGNALFEKTECEGFIKVIPDAMHSIGDTLHQLKYGNCVIKYNKKHNKFFIVRPHE